jgi:hypothetical protein
MIRKLDDPAITGRDMSSFAMSMMSGDFGANKVEPAVHVYKIFAEDGREELIRGLEFREVTLRRLKDIVSAGDDYHVHNLFADGRGGIFGMAPSFAGGMTDGTSGTTSSVIAPSMLCEELELTRISGSQQKPVLLGHRFFTE